MVAIPWLRYYAELLKQELNKDINYRELFHLFIYITIVYLWLLTLALATAYFLDTLVFIKYIKTINRLILQVLLCFVTDILIVTSLVTFASIKIYSYPNELLHLTTLIVLILLAYRIKRYYPVTVYLVHQFILIYTPIILAFLVICIHIYVLLWIVRNPMYYRINHNPKPPIKWL